MRGQHFNSPEEAADLLTLLQLAKATGAVEAGVFGSILQVEARRPNK